jgi:HlyD family secretion protein
MIRTMALRVVSWLAAEPRRWGTAVLVLAVGVAGLMWTRTGRGGNDTVTVAVSRGNLEVRLTATGILRPLQSITYRSPLAGRETEVTFLVPEGTLVAEGDLLVRLDSVSVERELEGANRELRQALVDVQMAEIEWQEGQSAVDSLSEGEAALALEETRARLAAAERRTERLREEQKTLAPLLDKGFITKEELRRTSDELERAEEELTLAKRRAELLVERTYPRDRRKAELQLSQKQAQRENVRARVEEMKARVKQLRDSIENASMYARTGGLVVHEEYLGANPRRKVRVGDRVTETQGLVTIPEVSRMQIEASLSEADVQRVHPGQPATVVLEAFRDRRFSGHVTRVGTLARVSADRSFEDKRFDLIVELDSSDADLRPEMTARVDILVGERSGVLLVPLNAIFEREGLPVAHVVRRFGTDTRRVRLGETGATQAEVVEGLAEGDRVALLDAPDSTVPTAPPPVKGLVPQGSPAAGAISKAPK